MDSVRYMPNDGALLDTSKHIGMAHSIYITRRYNTLVGIISDTDIIHTLLLQLLLPSLVLFH